MTPIISLLIICVILMLWISLIGTIRKGLRDIADEIHQLKLRGDLYDKR